MGKSQEFLDEAGNLSTDALKKILSNTIETIESNKSQIFDIYDRNTCVRQIPPSHRKIKASESS